MCLTLSYPARSRTTKIRAVVQEMVADAVIERHIDDLLENPTLRGHRAVRCRDRDYAIGRRADAGAIHQGAIRDRAEGPAKLRARVADHADRVSFGVPYVGNAEYWADVVAELRSGPPSD